MPLLFHNGSALVFGDPIAAASVAISTAVEYEEVDFLPATTQTGGRITVAMGVALETETALSLSPLGKWIKRSVAAGAWIER